jgi:adenylate kinase family enzyme
LKMEMARIVVIGNAGGGKSTLARRLAALRRLPYIEVDAFTWRPGWVLAPEPEYAAAHAQAIAGESWVLDGLGWLDQLRVVVLHVPDALADRAHNPGRR